VSDSQRKKTEGEKYNKRVRRQNRVQKLKQKGGTKVQKSDFPERAQDSPEQIICHKNYGS
jgi:CRISPR/Cas system-associated endoribonuclease Cas2